MEPGHAGVGHRAALDELHKAGELLLIAQAHVINKTAAQVPQAQTANQCHGQHHSGGEQQGELVGNSQMHRRYLRPVRQAQGGLAR